MPAGCSHRTRPMPSGVDEKVERLRRTHTVLAGSRRGLLERAADALRGHRTAGAEALRELADPQLLDHPRHLAHGCRERAAARPAVEPGAVGLLELVHRAHP